jgi:alpha-mannosidase
VPLGVRQTAVFSARSQIQNLSNNDYQFFFSGVVPTNHSICRGGTETLDNVVVTALKKAEDSDALIVRFYEWAGKETDVKLQFSPAVKSATETDLMEKPAGILPVQSDWSSSIQNLTRSRPP